MQLKLISPQRIGLNNLSFVSLMTFCFNLHNVINTNYGELEKLGKRYKTEKNMKLQKQCVSYANLKSLYKVCMCTHVVLFEHACVCEWGLWFAWGADKLPHSIWLGFFCVCNVWLNFAKLCNHGKKSHESLASHSLWFSQVLKVFLTSSVCVQYYLIVYTTPSFPHG